nr:hypothetical protein [Tanacetum cinerariifolium]
GDAKIVCINIHCHITLLSNVEILAKLMGLRSNLRAHQHGTVDRHHRSGERVPFNKVRILICWLDMDISVVLKVQAYHSLATVSVLGAKDQMLGIIGIVRDDRRAIDKCYKPRTARSRRGLYLRDGERTKRTKGAGTGSNNRERVVLKVQAYHSLATVSVLGAKDQMLGIIGIVRDDRRAIDKVRV